MVVVISSMIIVSTCNVATEEFSKYANEAHTVVKNYGNFIFALFVLKLSVKLLNGKQFELIERDR